MVQEIKNEPPRAPSTPRNKKLRDLAQLHKETVSVDALALSVDALALSADALALLADALALSVDALALSVDALALSVDALALSNLIRYELMKCCT